MIEPTYHIHFVPGELLVVVDHNNENPDELTSRVESAMTSIAEELNFYAQEYGGEGIDTRIYVDGDNISTFSTSAKDTSHTSFARVRLLSGEPGIDLVRNGSRAINDFMRQLFADERPLVRNAGLRAVTPNWLMGGSPFGKTCGGPGSLPEPFNGGQMPDFYLVGYPHALDPADPKTKQAVDVIILDTIPRASDLVEDNDAVNFNHSEVGNVDILQQLSDSNVLKIHRMDTSSYDYIDTDTFPQTMSDHGLFIAGIIDKIAPGINPIHLVQVLNENGVGTIASLIDGINKALELRQGKDVPLVLNMSLSVAVPFADDQMHEYTDGAQPPDDGTLDLLDILKDPTLLEQYIETLFLGLEIARIDTDNVYIVAAAGNDRTGAPQPSARFPAAWPQAFGIGALKSDLSDYAPFSNKAEPDTQIDQGILTLGEDIIGPYLKESTGLAKWSGTSFAAGIASGVIALLIQKGVGDPFGEIASWYSESDPPERLEVKQKEITP